MIRSRAVLVAIGIDWEGRRQILAVEIAGRESTTSWRDLLLALKHTGFKRRAPGRQRRSSRGSSARWPKCCPKPAGSAATCTFCVTPSTIFRARAATTA